MFSARVSLKIISPLIAYLAIILGLYLFVSFGGILPGAVDVRSRGTPFPSFTGGGGKIASISMALSLLVAGICLAGQTWFGGSAQLKTRIRSFPIRLSSRTSSIPLGISLLAGLIAFHFSYPPDFGHTNFRLLWVDVLFPDKSPMIRTMYFIPSLLKRIFNEHPSMFTAVCVALSAYLFYDICRLARLDSRTTIIATLSFVVSAHMLSFYQPAEDVTLINALSLATLNFFLRGNAIVFGALSAIFLLSRPPAFTFIFSIFGILMVQLCLTSYEKLKTSGLSTVLMHLALNRFLLLSVIITLMIVSLTHIYWFLSEIHFLQVTGVPPDPSYKILTAQQTVDEFTISRFSGVYLLHALWILSPFVIAFALGGVSTRSLATGDNAAIITAIAVTYFFANIIFLEYIATKLLYFNWRYLIYPYPFMLLAAWALLDKLWKARVPIALPLAAALVTSIISSSYRSIANDLFRYPPPKPIFELYYERETVRAIAKGRELVAEQGQLGQQDINWIIALTHKYPTIEPIQQAAAKSNSVVLTAGRHDGWAGLRLIAEIGKIQFMVPKHGDKSGGECRGGIERRHSPPWSACR